MGGITVNDRKALDLKISELCEMFPILVERKNSLAGNLSGGEQKVVETARALMIKPDLVLLDEPTLGLEPRMAQFIFSTIRQLRIIGVTVLMVEQRAREALEIVDRCYVLEQGQIVISASGTDLLHDPEVKRLYLGGSKMARK